MLTAILGIALVVVGVTLLVLVDAPRRALLRIAHLGIRHRSVTRTSIQGDFIAYQGLPPGWYVEPRNSTISRYWDGTSLSDGPKTVVQTPAADPDPALSLAQVESPAQSAASSPGPEAPFRGLPAGWYEDPDDPRLARYWDGTALSEERRQIASSSRPEGSEQAEATEKEGRPVDSEPKPDEVEPDELVQYRGLAPGWYRDPTDPETARFWDGSSLSDERRAVARQ